MALKACKECGVQVSDKAKVCPSCGIRKPGQSSPKWVWIALAAVVLFIIFTPKNHYPTDSGNSTAAASTEPAGAAPAESAEPNIQAAEKQIQVAMQDPRKVRLMECMGVNPWKEKPAGWTPPTDAECDQLKQVLGAEADARER